MQARKMLQQICGDANQLEHLMLWAVHFLNHSKLLDQQGSWANSNGSAVEVFQAFLDCFGKFERICELDHFDGRWISPVVDHMLELLVCYAEDADEETLPQSHKIGDSEALHVEKAQTTMESLCRRLIHGQRNPPDNRKFAAYFLVLRAIKVSFALNNFNNCPRHFSFIERAEQVERDMLPRSWHVGVAYYRGRLYLYQNDLRRAKQELERAFELCHKDYCENKQRILRYLIPVEVAVAGKFPSKKLLQEYDLLEYQDVVEACL